MHTLQIYKYIFTLYISVSVFLSVESAGLRTFDPRVTSLTPYQEGDEFAQITIDDGKQVRNSHHSILSTRVRNIWLLILDVMFMLFTVEETYLFPKYASISSYLSPLLKGLILCWRSLLPHTSGWERWSQSFTEIRSIEVKDAVIIARGLMCEATMTNNTGLNSIISWAVDLNDRKSPFQSEYSCRSEQWSWSLFTLKLSSRRHSFYILMICDVSFCYVIFWECNLGNHNQITWLNNRRSHNFMNIHVIWANQSLLSHHDWISGHGWISYFLWFHT